MKEYLGLGVIFSAIDKGLAKSLNVTAKGVAEVDNKLKKTKDTADAGGKKGGVLNGLYEGIKLLSLSQIGSTLSDMQDAMSGAGSGIEDTFKKLDTLQTKLAFTFDGKQAQSLNNALLTTMRTAGLTGDETETIAQNFMEFGRSTGEAVKSLPMIGDLVGKLGLDAGKVSQMYGQGLATLRATPDALSGVVKEIVSIQKAYNLTDQVSQLPEIFESVTKNSAMFGKVNAQTALSTVRSISGLSAVFQKVGMSQTQALNAATGFGDKLSSLKRSVSDMRAGLDPLDSDLYDAAQTLSLMGFSGEEAFGKIFEGADNPMKLAEDLNAQFMTLSEQQQNIVAARFRRIFGDEATNLLQGYGDEAKKAFGMGKDATVKGQPDKVFDDYTKALTGTVDVQEKLTASSKAYMEIMTSFVNKDKTIEVLQMQRATWDQLTKAVTDSDSILGKVLAKMQLFKDLGLAGFFSELAPLGIALSLLTPLIFPLANLVGILKLFGKLPLKLISGFFGMMGSGLGVSGMKAKALLTPMKLLKTIFEHLYVSVGVKMIDAFAKLQKGLGFVLRLINPLMTAFRTLALVIGLTPIGWVTAAVIGLGVALAAIVYYWDDIKKAASDFFNWIGPILDTFITNVAKDFGLEGVWEGMKKGFSSAVDWIKEVWSGLSKWISEKVSFENILGKNLSNLLGFGKSEGDEQKMLAPVQPKTAKNDEKLLGPVQPKTAKEEPGFFGKMFGGSDDRTPTSTVMPIMQQEGVAAAPTFQTFSDQKPEEVSDPNIQALLNEISRLGQIMAQMGQAMIERPVEVSIQGDVKKFFKAVSQEQKNQMGQRMAGGAY